MSPALRSGADVLLGRMRSPENATGEHMASYLRAANVVDGVLLLDDIKTMNFSPVEQVRYALEPGDILVTEGSGSRSTVGASAVWPGSSSPTMFQNTLLRLRARSHVEPRFLYWWSRHAYLSGLYAEASQGLAIWHLGAERIRGLPFEAPNRPEQRRIADFLDDQIARLDRAAHLRQRQLELIDAEEGAATRELVAGGGEGTSPSEAPWVGPLGPETELRSMARLLTLQRGVDLALDSRIEGPYPVVTTGGVVGTHSSAVAQGPGVVIGRYGSVGSVFWVNSDYWPHNTTLYVKDYRGNRPRFVYYLLRSYPYDRLQARAAVPGINRNDMKADLMPWMPVERQDESIKACDMAAANAANARDVLARGLGILAERKQALITAAVTGQLDVTTARAVA
jgi:type I restriction enzyme S subunit